ncbi:hypothetical protein FF2_000704 [Malus domestica]
MNSPHPSNTWPPLLAAWFFKHSLYLTLDAAALGGGYGGAASALKFDPLAIVVAALGVTITGVGVGSRSLLDLSRV